MCNEKLLFQVHSHLLSFLSQIRKDFEKEVYVGKQNIKSKKKYFCLITSALPLLKAHSLPRTQFYGADGNFCHLSHLQVKKDRKEFIWKIFALQTCFIFLYKDFRGGNSVPYIDRIGKKSLERCLKGKMSLRFNWLSLNLSFDRSWEFIPYLHCPLQFWVEMPK